MNRTATTSGLPARLRAGGDGNVGLMTTTDAILQLRDLVPAGSIGMFSSINPGGEIHSRPLTLQEIDDSGSLWFLASVDSDWVAGMKAGETVNFSIADNDDKTWVSIAGRAQASSDRARIHRLWDAEAEYYFPEDQDSPKLRLIEVVPDEAEYWDVPASAIGRMRMAAANALGRETEPTSGSIDLN